MAGSQAGGGAAPGGEYSGGRAGTRPQRGRGGGGGAGWRGRLGGDRGCRWKHGATREAYVK